MTVYADRVAVVSTSVGTGSMTLGSAAFSYRAWVIAYPDGPVYYGIIDEATGDWEIGEGTLSGVGSSLSRDTVLSSSTGGTKVPFASGTKIVYSPEPGISRNNDMGTF